MRRIVLCGVGAALGWCLGQARADAAEASAADTGPAGTNLAGTDPGASDRGAAVPAQDAPEPGFTLGYLASVPDDAWSILSAPTRWSGRQWLEAGLVGAAGGLLYGFDTRIRTIVQDHRSATTDRIAKIIRPFGQEYIAVPLGVAAGASFFSDDPRLARTALLGTESLALSLATYGGVQVLTNRARPSAGEGKAHWHGPGFTHDHSFPSGEVTAAFSCATILADEWRDVPGVAPIAYGVATAVAWERLNYNAHWASDLFAGAVLGYTMSTAVERLHPLHLGTRYHISIFPILTPEEKALAVTWNF